MLGNVGLNSQQSLGFGINKSQIRHMERLIPCLSLDIVPMRNKTTGYWESVLMKEGNPVDLLQLGGKVINPKGVNITKKESNRELLESLPREGVFFNRTTGKSIFSYKLRTPEEKKEQKLFISAINNLIREGKTALF